MPNRTAIIVGVGPGLGFAIARAFAEDGHDVALLARDTDRLRQHAAELQRSGQRIRAYATDAEDPSSLRGALHAAIEDLGEPDVVVYNAALMRQDSPMDRDDAGWRTAFAVDVLGAKITAEAAFPAMRDGRGSILFTGGGFALSPAAEFASMSAGKAALRAYVQTLRDAVSESDVHVAQVTITGAIGSGAPGLEPANLAKSYLELHRQSKSDWQWELLCS